MKRSVPVDSAIISHNSVRHSRDNLKPLSISLRMVKISFSVSLNRTSGERVRELANSHVSQTLHSPTVCHFKVLFAFLLKGLQHLWDLMDGPTNKNLCIPTVTFFIFFCLSLSTEHTLRKMFLWVDLNKFKTLLSQKYQGFMSTPVEGFFMQGILPFHALLIIFLCADHLRQGRRCVNLQEFHKWNEWI